MPNNFIVTLDTTGPASPSIVLAAGATYATAQTLTATIGTGDSITTGYQMKVWGDVDKAYNTNIQSQENSIANPITAPTLAASGTGSGLTASTYYVVYTWADGVGETLKSPEASVAVTAGQNLSVTVPTLPSGTNLKANIYISTATGTEKLQGSTTSTTYSQTTAISTGTVAPPVSNNLTGATWISYNTSQQVNLITGDGTKTVYLKLRDDVFNESAIVNDTIILDTTKPVPNITTSIPSPLRMSIQASKDSFQFTFTSDSDFNEYKVKLVANASNVHDAAGDTVVGTANGSVNTAATGNWTASTSTITVTLKAQDLRAISGADGDKVIKVFVKDLSGLWSL